MSSLERNNSPYRFRPMERLGAISWVVVVCRMLVGSVFVFSGFSKILLPHAEVMVLVAQYEVIPDVLIPGIAGALPWLELVSGTALLMGWCATPVAILIAGQLLSFIGLMLVVLAAGIDIADCGCFGNLGLRETPLQVLIRDVVMVAMLGPVLWRQRDAWSLDAWGT